MTPIIPTILLTTVALLLGCGAENSIKTNTQDPLQQQVDKLVFVEGGSFQMGDAGTTDENGQFRYRASRDARPVHQVTLSSYSIQAYETTFAEFDAYSKAIGEEIVGPDNRHWKSAKPNHPAEWMTWQQARDYCQWLGNNLGYPMDLPTEAQWEYAARSRGNPNVAFATDSGHTDFDRNIRDAAVTGFTTMPVGTWPPNPLGIYDMTGNVAEWTLDWWQGYRKAPRTNPNNHEARKGVPGRSKMVRGGGIMSTFSLYTRIHIPPETTGAGTGVRCVVNHPEKITSPRQSAQ